MAADLHIGQGDNLGQRRDASSEIINRRMPVKGNDSHAHKSCGEQKGGRVEGATG